MHAKATRRHQLGLAQSDEGEPRARAASNGGTDELLVALGAEPLGAHVHECNGKEHGRDTKHEHAVDVVNCGIRGTVKQ